MVALEATLMHFAHKGIFKVNNNQLVDFEHN